MKYFSKTNEVQGCIVQMYTFYFVLFLLLFENIGVKVLLQLLVCVVDEKLWMKGYRWKSFTTNALQPLNMNLFDRIVLKDFKSKYIKNT